MQNEVEKPLSKDEIQKKKTGRKPILTKKQVSEIRKVYREWIKNGDENTMADLAKKYKTTRQTIHNAIYGLGAYEEI